MAKDEMIENLGTIAHSGSSTFVENLNKAGTQAQLDTLIGQFGVGFYSTFIVSEYVEVISKTSDSKATKWTSDGSVTFINHYRVPLKLKRLMTQDLKEERRLYSSSNRILDSLLKKEILKT